LNDEKIIKAIKEGDAAAIDQVITKYSRLMWSVAGTVLKNAASRQDIEECVADVFIYLWQNPDKYDAERGRLKSWLSMIAKTQAINRYRLLAKHNEAPLDDKMFARQLGVMEGILEEDAKRSLTAAVRELEEPDQEILVRRYYYDQKPKEIAFALDLPVKTVENRLYRAKRKLREMIAN